MLLVCDGWESFADEKASLSLTQFRDARIVRKESLVVMLLANNDLGQIPVRLLCLVFLSLFLNPVHCDARVIGTPSPRLRSFSPHTSTHNSSIHKWSSPEISKADSLQKRAPPGWYVDGTFLFIAKAKIQKGNRHFNLVGHS